MLMFIFYMVLGNLSSDDLNANENVSLENVHLHYLSYLTHTSKHDLDLNVESLQTFGGRDESFIVHQTA